MKGCYLRKILSKLRLKLTSMNNQRNHMAKHGDIPLQDYFCIFIKNISNVHLYVFFQDRISPPIQINSFECSGIQ